MRFFTVGQAAEHVGCHRNTVGRAIKDGRLPSTAGRIRGQKAQVVSQTDLETWYQTIRELDVGDGPGAPKGTRDDPGSPGCTREDPIVIEAEVVEVPSGEPWEDDECTLVDPGAALDKVRFDIVTLLAETQKEARELERRLGRAESRAEMLALEKQQNQRLLAERNDVEMERQAREKTLVSANEYLTTQNEDLKVQLDLARAKLAEEASLSLWARFRRKVAPSAQSKVG